CPSLYIPASSALYTLSLHDALPISESLSRIEVVRFAQRIRERYTPPDLDILLLLPCAARKPYSTSQSHQKFILTLGKYRKFVHRSEEHTSELQSRENLVCRLLLEKK